MRIGEEFLGQISRRVWLSLPSIARLPALGLAAAFILAPLAAEAQERAHPKQSVLDVVALASDPSLWNKMAPFQSVFAQPSPDGTAYCYYCFSNDPCLEARCQGGKCFLRGLSGNSCNDGNQCTTSDTCKNGVCVGTPITGATCDDGNTCTTNDACSNTGICVGVPLTGTSCDDGNSCTANDTCSNKGICVGTRLPNGTSCNDGNDCTANDTCSNNGICVGVPLTGTSCVPYGSCIRNTCFNGTCEGGPITNLPDGTSCDDLNPCTANDACQAGFCVGTRLPDRTTCSAFSPFCSTSYLCYQGYCTGFSCDDFDLCTSDSCDPATLLCTHSPIGCDDGIACTADSCDPTIGCVHTAPNCDDGNACTADSCDPATGLCVSVAGPGEAGPLGFADQVTLTWKPAVDVLISNTYRGTIPPGYFGSRIPVYDHVCFESADAQMNGPQTSVDAEDPPVGTAFYYLVDGEALSCGEGPLGTATDGTPEMPIAFCPTPP